MKSKSDVLKNSIGLQLNFYTYSGATMEETVERIHSKAIDYSNDQIQEANKNIAQLNSEADFNQKIIERKTKEIEELKEYIQKNDINI